MVLIAPTALWIPICVVISYLFSGLGPETCLAIGTSAGIGLTDARIIRDVWKLSRDAWIMETKNGLDILTPDSMRVVSLPPTGLSRSSF